jgi:hypothetical protein
MCNMEEHPSETTSEQIPKPQVTPPKSSKRWLKVLVILAVLLATALIIVLIHQHASAPAKNTSTVTSATSTQTKTTATKTVEGLTLDPTKNYGNLYANNILPVGDSKYVTDGAKQGYVYVCHANFVPAGQAGAQTRGPWFVNNNTQYDLSKKAHINGSVDWTQQFSVSIQNGKRIIVTNDLPNHPTGIFPVAASDPARIYDANPNSIKTQALTYSLTAEPTYGTPQCMGGEVGVMLTGVALFNAFDAGGRDAGAWEIQDSCSGHPQEKGEYHYHTLGSCITDQSVKTVIGYALDGFPITGPKVGDNNILTTTDLDECHGIVSDVLIDNKMVTTYHYVMTQDFPYSASCFRAPAISAPGMVHP